MPQCVPKSVLHIGALHARSAGCLCLGNNPFPEGAIVPLVGCRSPAACSRQWQLRRRAATARRQSVVSLAMEAGSGAALTKPPLACAAASFDAPHALVQPASRPTCMPTLPAGLTPTEGAAKKLAEEFSEFDAGLVGELLEQEDGDEGEHSTAGPEQASRVKVAKGVGGASAPSSSAANASPSNSMPPPSAPALPLCAVNWSSIFLLTWPL